MPATLTTEAAAVARLLERVGEADAIEQLAEGRRLLDTDQPRALIDQDLQAPFIVGRGGGDRTDIAADGTPDDPQQPAHDADRRQQRDRPWQAQSADPRLFEGVGQGIDHVPEHEAEDEGQQQATSCHEQVYRGRDDDCPKGGALEGHGRAIVTRGAVRLPQEMNRGRPSSLRDRFSACHHHGRRLDLERSKCSHEASRSGRWMSVASARSAHRR